MTDERMIEELARIDGYKHFKYDMATRARFPGGAEFEYTPDYLNDHNAVQPIIDRMCLKELVAYDRELYTLIPRDKASAVFMHQATAKQKCEAILKAYGKWEES